jgi:hypothetical protein
MPKSLNPAERATQTPVNAAFTETGKSGDKSGNQNLVSGLFSKSEMDADLRTVIERWESLSVALRLAIVKIVQ